MRKYSVFQLFYLAICKLRGFFLFSNAKIIRFPIDVRGRSAVKVGNGFTTGKYCRIEAFPKDTDKSLFIGENFQMNDFVHITAMERVLIGDNVLIASKVYISDCSHGSYKGNSDDSPPDSIPKDRTLFSIPVTIENNVWIGESVSILPGVTIGEGSIVGANSVVSRNLPPYVIAVGIPAKPIKKYNFETKIWEKY